MSDHDPDARGIPHAVDISQSMPGAPFWLPTYGQFNAHAYGELVAQRIIAGTETRVKYLVSHNYQTGSAKIFDPNVGRLYWRDQPGDNHASHLHVSFCYTTFAEDSTAPFFQPASSSPPEDDMPLNAADIEAIRQIVKQTIEDAIGGSQMTPPDPHATVLEVIKHVEGK